MEIRQGSSKPRANSPSKPTKRIGIEVGSLFFFTLAAFSFASLATYSPKDPSLFTLSHAVAANACGKAGAYLASVFLQYIGLGGFLLPLGFLFLGVTLHNREGKIEILGRLGGLAVSVMALTVFLSLQWTYWSYSGANLLTGGILGIWASNELLIRFNSFGSSVVSLFIFFVALSLSTPIAVTDFLSRAMSRMGAWIVQKGFAFIKHISLYLAYALGAVAIKVAHKLGDYLSIKIQDGMSRIKEKRAKKIEQEALVSELIDSEDEAQSLRSIEPELIEMSKDIALAEQEELPLPHKSHPEIILSDREVTSEIDMSEISKSAKKPRKLGIKTSVWKLPPTAFLKKPMQIHSAVDRKRLEENSNILVQKFADFGISGEVVAVRPGPVVTLYEFKPGPGVKVSRIASLADDISMALSAQSVRIVAPIPGKSVVGIEIPSDAREKVFFKEFLTHAGFNDLKNILPVAMGKDISGQVYLSDLAKMPHLLVAGQTGAGKSVFMNALICSLFYRFTPDELRMILVDPKFIEFRSYQDVPHLLLPVVDDPKHASTALKWAVREMERRYRILAIMGARNLASYNQRVEELGIDAVSDLLTSGEDSVGLPGTGSDWIEAFERDEAGEAIIGKLPFVVIIIDELADLMMVAKKDVEVSIARIAQKARAAGIHLVIATQRPSTDVITGLIKANLPSRVSFQLASYIDSKTIIDRAGAERLLGQGDMLFIPPGGNQLMRLHGAYVDDEEIEKVTNFLRSQGKPVYRDEILVDEEEEKDELESSDDDSLFPEAIHLVKRQGHASASFLQRHLKVGYNRAARMIEKMEERGIVGPADGARPREVLLRQ